MTIRETKSLFFVSSAAACRASVSCTCERFDLLAWPWPPAAVVGREEAILGLLLSGLVCKGTAGAVLLTDLLCLSDGSWGSCFWAAAAMTPSPPCPRAFLRRESASSKAWAALRRLRTGGRLTGSSSALSFDCVLNASARNTASTSSSPAAGEAGGVGSAAAAACKRSEDNGRACTVILTSFPSDPASASALEAGGVGSLSLSGSAREAYSSNSVTLGPLPFPPSSAPTETSTPKSQSNLALCHQGRASSSPLAAAKICANQRSVSGAVVVTLHGAPREMCRGILAVSTTERNFSEAFSGMLGDSAMPLLGGVRCTSARGGQQAHSSPWHRDMKGYFGEACHHVI